MAIALVAVTLKHSYRIRLSFSEALAAGAFTTLSYYGCTNTDGGGIDPGVEAAFVVPNSPNVVELQFGNPLVGGALYSITAVGVPGVDATTTPPGTGDTFSLGRDPVPANVEAPVSDLDALVYGIDLVHDGSDMVETSAGDLATVTGLANASQAIWRRETGHPLLWDPDYSPKLRSYVDGSAGALAAARGEILRQAQLDDRVDTADVKLTFDPTVVGGAFFTLNVVFIGAPAPIPIKITVPNA